MMITVLIYKESRYSVNRQAIRSLVEEFLTRQGVKGKVEVGVAIVGNRKMRDLNKKYAQKDETTDVLSFSLEENSEFVPPQDGVLRLGDIVVSYPEAVKNASDNNLLVEDEIKSLVTHGLSHLLGIHHEE